MGMFDFLKSKKQKEQEEMEELAEGLAKMFTELKEMKTQGIDADRIPNGHGPYGLCATNPIPTTSPTGSNIYLGRLRLNGRNVSASRFGSTSAKDVTAGMIDIYNLTQDGKGCGTIYVCHYHKRISGIPPQGFTLA